MPVEKKIWVLLDDRQGNSNQSLGVADALGLPYETKQVGFNRLMKLPNFLINRTARGIDGPSRASLTPPWPDMVIATARRLSVVATYIKAQNPKCFLAQVQWPGMPSGDFDLIATPAHDAVHRRRRNVIHTIGAPHRVTAAKLQAEAAAWETRFAPYPHPRFALLLGGSTHSKAFAGAATERLAAMSSRLVNAVGGSLLISTSRRTNAGMLAALTSGLSCPYYLYEWNSAMPLENPYYAFLGTADAIIVTGDSISMCSEACTTGKPVYIYSADEFTAKKYRRFHAILYQRGLAQPLPENAQIELFTPSGILDDTQNIAMEIRKRTGL